jgi:hypothetical protein
MRRRPLPRWTSLAFFAIGLFIVLLSLDVVPYAPLPGRQRALFTSPHHWWVTSIGLSFMATAPLVAFRHLGRPWRPFFSVVGGVAFIAPMTWFVLDGPLPPTERLLFGIPLGLALIGIAISVRRSLTGKVVFDPHALDPMEAARILRTHGREEQAEAVLRHAMRWEPERAEEFKRAIDAMKRRSHRAD